jgi:3-isopropylmalate dehydrogenase
MESLAAQDVLLLGAIGDPNVPSGILERGLLLKLRFGFDHYVNLRPTKLYPGVASKLADPGEVDFIVVREGTEGPYVGTGGSIRQGTPEEVANEVSVNTAYGVERVVRYAFKLAASRTRKKLTLVHKHNVLVHSGALYQRIVNEVAKEHPNVDHDYLHVDAATIFMVTEPSRFDVIVTDNLFGDILTDLAAAISGGIGLAASGNLNPSGKFPSMFEPVHGSAPDIAGKALADPTAAIASASRAPPPPDNRSNARAKASAASGAAAIQSSIWIRSSFRSAKIGSASRRLIASTPPPGVAPVRLRASKSKRCASRSNIAAVKGRWLRSIRFR